jgi:hypothetical protein
MKYLLIFSLFLSLSCSKQKSMEQRPLKAVPSYGIDGKTITLLADKSEGDVCAYGWQVSVGSPVGANVTFSPNSSIQAQKNPDRDQPDQPYYLTGTLQFSPITANVDKAGTYIFSLQVLDAFRNESWADLTIEVK